MDLLPTWIYSKTVSLEALEANSWRTIITTINDANYGLFSIILELIKDHNRINLLHITRSILTNNATN